MLSEPAELWNPNEKAIFLELIQFSTKQPDQRLLQETFLISWPYQNHL